MERSTIRGFELYPLRFGLSVIFGYNGLDKLIHRPANEALFDWLGLPFAPAANIFIGTLELLLAVAFVTGIGVRIAGAAAALFAAVVAAWIKIPGPFWSDGWGIDVAVLSGAMTLAILGGGRPVFWSSGTPGQDRVGERPEQTRGI